MSTSLSPPQGDITNLTGNQAPASFKPPCLGVFHDTFHWLVFSCLSVTDSLSWRMILDGAGPYTGVAHTWPLSFSPELMHMVTKQHISSLDLLGLTILERETYRRDIPGMALRGCLWITGMHRLREGTRNFSSQPQENLGACRITCHTFLSPPSGVMSQAYSIYSSASQASMCGQHTWEYCKNTDSDSAVWGLENLHVQLALLVML